MEKKLAPSKMSASKTIFTAFNIIKDNHNEMPIKDLLKEIEKKISFTEWEKERYEKSGYIRWQSIFHFYSIDCIKAGYLIKKNGIWYLTPEGLEALKDGEQKLFENFTKGYKKWTEKRVVNLNNNDNDDEDEIETETEIEKNEDMLIYNDLLEKALEVMSDFINKKNAYEFQDLVAALLRGMGYYTPFIAPKGKDGGVDIIAYKDPLGTTIPRIQVQIKHKKENVASVKEIRELMGLLQKDGDVGIFVSSSGFSSDAKTTARTSNTHIELIDLNRFIELWQNFYNNLSDQDKNLFPLKPIYFLDLNI
jgi:restriction system protein